MDKAKKQKIITILICILLSFSLWLYTISSEAIEINIRIPDVPVTIINADALEKQNLVLVPGKQIITNTSIKGIANAVYGANADDFSLVVDMSEVSVTEGKNLVPVKATRLPSNTSLNGSLPKVEVTVEKLVTKSVDIRKDRVKYAAKEGFYVPEPKLNEPAAMIKGPQSFVDKVVAVQVEATDKKDISGNIEEYKRVLPVDAEGNEVSNINISTGQYVIVSYTAYNVKEVPVKVNTKNSVDQSIDLKEYVSTPGVVRVTARESILKNIDEIETEPLDLSQLKLQTKEYPLKLAVPYDVIVLDDKNNPMPLDIQVSVNMDSFATKEIEKPVITVGTPLSPVTLTQDKVKIVVSGTKEKIESLNVNDFTATVNVDGLKPGAHKVDVKITAPVDYMVKMITPDKIDLKVGP